MKLALGVLSLLTPALPTHAMGLFVGQDGDDTNAGTKADSQPL